MAIGPEAVRRWSGLHERFSTDRVVMLGLAEALARHGDLDTAENLFRAALQPLAGGDLAATNRQIRHMMIVHAELATQRGEFKVARDRWRILAKHLPDDPEIQAGFEAAIARLGVRAAVTPAPDMPDSEAERRRQTILQFESLGSSCEFGLVQRHFGAEPLGLFRWVSLSAPNLIEALRTDLAGIGDLEHTDMHRSTGGEFMTSDSRYRLQMHTFIKDTGQDQRILFNQLRRRMVFLKRKLLEDLAAGEKIFVYRAAFPIRRERILAIANELQRYNAANRLAAVLADTPNIETTLLAPGVLCTKIRNGRLMPQGTGWNIDFSAWQNSCETALKAMPAQRK